MLVVIKGAGDLATGTALRLRRAGFRVIMTELPRPTAIRRTVCFSQAVLFGSWTVEDVTARLAETPGDALTILERGEIAGVDCHAVVETMRGHYLGRVIREGSAQPNTAVPGLVGGFAGERVLRAPADGVFRQLREIGDIVEAGDAAGTVDGLPMVCQIGGVLRGILADDTPVHKGMKAGDVDPRCEIAHCYCASDKALAVGGGVLEAALSLTGALRKE